MSMSDILFMKKVMCLIFAAMAGSAFAEFKSYIVKDGRPIDLNVHRVDVSKNTTTVTARNGRTRTVSLDQFSETSKQALLEFAVGGSAQKRKEPPRSSDTSGGMFANKAAVYPQFSWDKMPLYMHVRKSTDFTKAEIEYLAKFDLITFEKTTGSSAHGSTEKGIIAAAQEVKKVNPNVTILYYRNVLCDYGGYDVCELTKAIPGAQLVDQKNGNTKLHRNIRGLYDLSKPELREVLVENIREVCSHNAVDGVFFDGLIKVFSGFAARQVGKEKKAAVIQGYRDFAKETRAAIGSDKLIIANIIRDRFKDCGLEYMDYLDGSYLEAIPHPNGENSDKILKVIKACQTAGRDGKIIALPLGLGNQNFSEDNIDEVFGNVGSFQEANQKVLYQTAFFLITAEKYSYLYLHGGYASHLNKLWMKWPDIYDKPIGEPKGDFVDNGNGILTREFEHVSVWLDIKNEVGKLTWCK